MSCAAPKTQQYWVADCQRWACEACKRKVALQWLKILSWAAEHGPAPQFFLTLTLKEPLPLWKVAPAEEQAAQREQGVVELTTGRRTPGHRPHLHLLARGPAIAKRWLSDRWAFHTKGSFKVDVQRLRSPRLAGDYLVGYTLGRRKKAQHQYLSHWPGPRIRYSRGFFPQPVPQIQALLWPPKEPGVWEYVGMLPYHLQITWELRDDGHPTEPMSAAPG